MLAGCRFIGKQSAEHAFHRMGGDQELTLFVLLSLLFSPTRPPVNLVFAADDLTGYATVAEVTNLGTLSSITKCKMLW
jgi:hypothetical protein